MTNQVELGMTDSAIYGLIREQCDNTPCCATAAALEFAQGEILAIVRSALQASRSEAAPPPTDEESAGCGGLNEQP